MTNRRTAMATLGGAVLAAVVASGAMAQEVTLRLHQFLPAQANVPKLILDVWADNVERDSAGRIKVDRFPSMQLGGAPPELIDQVVDGVADVIWTVVGYTPGRFPMTEVFELPFFVTDARAASSAYWQMYEAHMKDTEFKDVHMLGTWVHGPGLFHTADPVATPADLQGMKIRGASRMVNQMLEKLGAEPVGMPVPAIPEALSKGVIDGATIPWEVTGSLKVPELVQNHTEFEGAALYNITFVLAMNKGVYAGLPDDLKVVIDKNSGLAFSIFAGGTQADADAPARQVAVDLGNTIVTISAADAAANWMPLVEPIYADWVADMATKGIDGQALIDEARALMAAYK
ncbi:TRAP-type C4-dicarboxylate transport system, substrate-binding protein [Pseudorhodobacter antarcticus]|uniref:TRAP-type C4-dicarboxylate transport system, substrate-binding protein n=1 Tax=Pseudorhodobacter antarcticus TaxID=1077947 RepID=A0A1H8EKA5_9RHOB|nr:TRAP transporter substrate-binding protein [Pseudorhodobacter antarcticus]SEN19826.1 TRAP-type C4-dicarboxylate transport system, substrate-binding protein [Pseudorhodobacter antarcticus]